MAEELTIEKRLEKLENEISEREFAASRGWKFRMASSEGSIRRVGRDFFGPGDRYLSIFHMFEMLEGGTGEWYARHSYERKPQSAEVQVSS